MARTLVQCRMHGGYYRPDWVVDGSVMDRIDEGVILELPEVEVARLVSTFGPTAWRRIPVPGSGPSSRSESVARDASSLSVRDILPAIRAGEFDDVLDVLQRDQRGTVAKVANARARTLARG